MLGQAPGTTAPAGQAANCAPSYPAVGWSSGYVCIAQPEPGTRFDGNRDGLEFCLYSGLAGRATGFWTCQSPDAVVPGDVVANQDGGASLVTAGQVACQARGMTTATFDSYGQHYLKCAGTVSSLVSDATSQGKLDTLASKVDSFASANHTDLGAVRSSISSASGSAASGTSQTGDFAIMPVLNVLFAPVLFALLVALLWTFWKRVAR